MRVGVGVGGRGMRGCGRSGAGSRGGSCGSSSACCRAAHAKGHSEFGCMLRGHGPLDRGGRVGGGGGGRSGGNDGCWGGRGCDDGRHAAVRLWAARGSCARGCTRSSGCWCSSFWSSRPANSVRAHSSSMVLLMLLWWWMGVRLCGQHTPPALLGVVGLELGRGYRWGCSPGLPDPCCRRPLSIALIGAACCCSSCWMLLLLLGCCAFAGLSVRLWVWMVCMMQVLGGGVLVLHSGGRALQLGSSGGSGSRSRGGSRGGGGARAGLVLSCSAGCARVGLCQACLLRCFDGLCLPQGFLLLQRLQLLAPHLQLLLNGCFTRAARFCKPLALLLLCPLFGLCFLLSCQPLSLLSLLFLARLVCQLLLLGRVLAGPLGTSIGCSAARIPRPIALAGSP
mmetsp:Transcript_3504/g.9380  ORF Transcript_3504/g.9380 Transcript_3504/m.9380 type:complete len:395 (-) Transcript_3504:483-1667(-)